jgi:CBS domain-containing protein
MVTHQTDRRPSLTHTTVAEAMHPGVVMCGAEQRLPVVAATMALHAVHTVVVPSAHGGPALAITALDLLQAGSEAGWGDRRRHRA